MAAFGLLLLFHSLRRIPAFLGEEVLRVDQLDSVLFRECFGAFAYHQNRSAARVTTWWALRFIEKLTSEQDRILDVLQVCNRAGAHRLALHC